MMMIGGGAEEQYSTPAFDKARMLYLRRTQQQLVPHSQNLSQSQDRGQLEQSEDAPQLRSTLDELTHSLRKLRFRVDVFFSLVLERLAEAEPFVFDGQRGTISALERIADELVELQNNDQTRGVHTQEASPVAPTPPPAAAARSRPQAPFPWPIVDMAELEFGTDRTWVDTHSIAIVTSLPRMDQEGSERLRSLLLKLVRHIATIEDIRLPMNADQSLSKGFAFIRTRSPLDAWKVATAMDGFPWLVPNPDAHPEEDGGATPSSHLLLQARMFSSYGKESGATSTIGEAHARRAGDSEEVRAHISHNRVRDIDEDDDDVNYDGDDGDDGIRENDEGYIRLPSCTSSVASSEADEDEDEDVEEQEEDAQLRFDHCDVPATTRRSWDSKAMAEARNRTVNGMLPFLRDLSSDRASAPAQLSRTAPASAIPIVLPPVHDAARWQRVEANISAAMDEVLQTIRGLNGRLRKRPVVEPFSDELDTLDLHLDNAAANGDLLKLFATEQAILQLHGLVVKHAAPSFASQPSNHAFFGLYQSSSTIVQKLFKNFTSEYQPHGRWTPPLREELQRLATLFERLRSSVLLNAVTEIGKGYETLRKEHLEEIQAVRAQLDNDYVRLRDQMSLARSLKAENDELRDQLARAADARAHEAAMWEARVQELQKTLRECSAATQRARQEAQSTLSLERLTKQLGAMSTYCARFDMEREFADVEGVLEAALAQVRNAKVEFIQRRARQEEGSERSQQNLCVICLDNEKSVLLMPCRHLCVCEECANHANLGRCPVCRDRIEQTIKVFA